MSAHQQKQKGPVDKDKIHLMDLTAEMQLSKRRLLSIKNALKKHHYTDPLVARAKTSVGRRLDKRIAQLRTQIGHAKMKQKMKQIQKSYNSKNRG